MIALVANTGAGSSDSNSVTTAAITTTGATLLVVGIADWSEVVLGTVTDSKGNTWTPRTTYTSSPNGSRTKLYYCASPTVGAGHTFTYTGTGGFPTICVSAWSGAHATPYDTENGHAQASGATVATGSITPSVDNCLLVSMYMSHDGNAGVAVDSGFTVSDFVNLTANHFEGGMAYLIQTTATAKNPTWTVTDSAQYSAAAVASFKVTDGVVVTPPVIHVSSRSQDRTNYGPGTPTVLGPAGFRFTDPIFGSRMARITDRLSYASFGGPDFSFATASGAYTPIWNADSTRFWLSVSNGGNPIMFDWDAATMTARQAAFTLPFNQEPCWHNSDRNVIVGSGSIVGVQNHHTVVQTNLSSGSPVSSILLDLDTIIPGLAARGDTYLGSCIVRNGVLFTIAGGASQDLHDYAIWYPLANPSALKLLNTLTRVGMDHFTMHSAQHDMSARYCDFVPSGGSAAPSRNYIWDTTLDTVTAVLAHSGGHEVLGFGNRINSDYIGTYDNIQWVYSDLATPNVQREVLNPVTTPPEQYVADHPTWHCAQPNVLVPFGDAIYRALDGPQDNPRNTVPWRPLDGEVVRVDPSGTTVPTPVWRFCHHHSLYYREAGIEAPTADVFYYTPRANISPDGRWILFTSNWGKTLGNANVGTVRRTDVFIVESLLDSASSPRAHRHSRSFR